MTIRSNACRFSTRQSASYRRRHRSRGTPELHPMAPRLGRRYRYLLQVSDVVTLTASAVLGCGDAQPSQPRARRQPRRPRRRASPRSRWPWRCTCTGLYRRPASRLRPSGWWRPGVIARCLPTAALLALAFDAFILRGGRMTLTAAVAMTVPAIVLVPFGRRLIVRTFDPTVTPHSGDRNGTDLGSTDFEAAEVPRHPRGRSCRRQRGTRHPTPRRARRSARRLRRLRDRPGHHRLPEHQRRHRARSAAQARRARCRYRRSRATSSCTTGAPRPRSCTASL